MPEMDTIELEQLYEELEKIDELEVTDEKKEKYKAVSKMMIDVMKISPILLIAETRIFGPAYKELEKIEDERQRELYRYYLNRDKQMFMKNLYERLSERLSS